MKIYRKAVFENWDDRQECLVAEMPRKEAQAWLDEHPDPDLIALTNEQEAHYGIPEVIQPLPPVFVQIMPSRDFIAVYHGSTEFSPKKVFENTPGRLESVVDWYVRRGVQPFIH